MKVFLKSLTGVCAVILLTAGTAAYAQQATTVGAVQSACATGANPCIIALAQYRAANGVDRTLVQQMAALHPDVAADINLAGGLTATGETQASAG